ncbi:inositol-pentakisphosphate 2-kinase [Favolaschia claudopus]|uniref:Inositol-pentakisphosphate 2-kinase n=1 Tax=Favolaschia claudopus TaxID=2862362 RepID=A0AAW0CH03_9AGAR
MSVTLTDTWPTDWSYVSEGGANIVLVYQGPPSQLFDGTALRLKKCSWKAEKPQHQEENSGGIQSVVFQKSCLERLVPPVHLPRLELVDVGKDGEKWLEALAALCEPRRFSERREKDGIDVTQDKALLATNLVGGRGIAVEIKPKWGFLPSPTYLSNSSQPIKTQTCRFCLHSNSRAQNGKTVSSGYCPLDLYSGDEVRMKTALDSLCDAWIESNGTINNFKVFVRGKMILPEDRSSLIGLVNDKQDAKEALTTALLPILKSTPVLQILSRLQQTLDPLDIEGLASLCNLQSPGPDPTVTEWTDFVTRYLEAPSPPPPADAAHLRYHILAHLLSATFKDCSLIVRVPDGTATLIDLDPKSIDRLRKWEKMDKELVAAYANVPVADRKVCADA